MLSIAFTGGGTGGHIYPGLAVYDELKKILDNVSGGSPALQYKIFWIGSSSGMDREIVTGAGIEFFGIPSGKLRRYFSFRNITDLFRIAGGFFAARKILKKQKVKLLFSKGGFVSVPPCAAAFSLGIPVFTHESDYSPGLATKINSRFIGAKGKIFTAYEETAKLLPAKTRAVLSDGDQIMKTGNPIRSIFNDADPAKGRAFLGLSDDARVILVLGGSQGAKEINELVAAALGEIKKIFTVVHQTGSNNEINAQPCERYKPYPYFKKEMPHVMAAAQIVMGRSGAGIWEWAFLGKPMILLPLRGSGTRGDQVENARFFEKAGAAQVLSSPYVDGKINPEEFLLAVNSLAQDSEKRNKMAEASAKICKVNSAQLIAGALAACINDQGGGKN